MLKVSLSQLGKIAAVAIAGAVISTPASATLFEFDIDNPSGSSAQGDITNFFTSYDDDAQALSVSFSVDNLLGDFAWLAVSPGPNPKGEEGELALLYFDLTGGDIYAYGYSGQNNGNSWQNPGDFITSFSNVISTSVVGSVTTFSLTNLAVSAIQAHTPTPDDTPGDWTGVAFGEQLGIWFHIADAIGLTTANGKITNLHFGSGQSWYDTRDRTTTVTDVAEPSVLALLGLGAFAAGAARRRKRA